MSKKLFCIGVGPGSPLYLTEMAKMAIAKSKYIIGYRYTLGTIDSIIDRKKQQVFEVTMKDQDPIYLKVYSLMNDDDFCTVPFTGDVNFSESEVVDRLLEIFGDDNVEIIPGISSIQVAAAKSKVPTDKSQIITFHVTGDIEEKKTELLDALRQKKSVILLPRPWPGDKEKNFMQSDIAKFLKENKIDTGKINTWVFENLTRNDSETVFKGKISDLENKEFSGLSVMVIDQSIRRTYLEF